MIQYKSVKDSIDGIKRGYSFWEWFIVHPKMNWLRWLIYNLPDAPKDCYNTIKWFIQRGIRGYSDFDTWDLDGYLSKVIKNSVIDLQKNGCGLPNDCNEKEWDEIMNKIIITFHTSELIAEGRYIYFSTYEHDYKNYAQFKKVLKDTKVFVMSYDDCKRYEKGWELFKKYFNNLWD